MRNETLSQIKKPLKEKKMSHQDTGTCEVCGSETFRYNEYKELLYENHCLSEDCGFFIVECEKESTEENCIVSGNWSGSDYRTPEEVREFIEEHELEDALDEEHELEDELDEEPCLVLTQDEIRSRIIDDCKRNMNYRSEEIKKERKNKMQ